MGPSGANLLGELRLRVRDVRQGPDGYLYIAADAAPDGAVLRIEPAAAASTATAAPR
jgi:glucose/arabinose dehydrogenase